MMKISLIRVGILFVIAILHYSDASPRIAGATVSTISQFPYLAQLRRRVGVTNNFNYHCTGTLVSATHLVTAAHCFEGLYNDFPSQWTIQVGATNQLTLNEGFSLNPTQISIHDEYNPTTFDNDVAVVTWQFPLWESSTISFIELNEAAVPESSAVTIAGWGGVNLAGAISNPLHFAVIPVVNLMQCRIENAWHNRFVTENMICAGTVGRGSCTNDRGLPLIYNNRLAGISSWRIGCGGINPPGVFTIILADDLWLLSALGIEVGDDGNQDGSEEDGGENGGDGGEEGEDGGEDESDGGDDGSDGGDDGEDGDEDGGGAGEDGEDEGEDGEDGGEDGEGGGEDGEDGGEDGENGGEDGEDGGEDGEDGGEDGEDGGEDGEDGGEDGEDGGEDGENGGEDGEDGGEDGEDGGDDGEDGGEDGEDGGEDGEDGGEDGEDGGEDGEDGGEDGEGGGEDGEDGGEDGEDGGEDGEGGGEDGEDGGEDGEDGGGGGGDGSITLPSAFEFWAVKMKLSIYVNPEGVLVVKPYHNNSEPLLTK